MRGRLRQAIRLRCPAHLLNDIFSDCSAIRSIRVEKPVLPATKLTLFFNALHDACSSTINRKTQNKKLAFGRENAFPRTNFGLFTAGNAGASKCQWCWCQHQQWPATAAGTASSAAAWARAVGLLVLLLAETVQTKILKIVQQTAKTPP